MTRRSALRRIGILAAVLLLAALAAVTAVRIHRMGELSRAADRFEATVGPLDFASYGPDPVPDAENAALPILEAMERLEAAGGERDWRAAIARQRQANHRAAVDWSVADRSRARGLLARRSEVLDLLHRARGRSGSSFDLDYAAGPTMEIPSLLLTFQAGDLLFAEARLAWLEGRPDDAVAAVESLAALSGALQAEAPLIFQVMGHSLEILQYRSVQDALATGGADPEAVRRLRAALEERPRSESLRGVLGAEGSFLYLVRPGGPYAEAVMDQQPWLAGIEYRWLGHDSVARGLEYYVRVDEAFPALAFAEWVSAPELLKPPRDGRMSTFVVNLRDSVGILKAAAALRHLAGAALDAAAVAAETAALPRELPGAPRAPDPFTGERPVYERSADGSATLSAPGAEELWERLRRGRVRGEDEAPLFTWHLAPLSSSARPAKIRTDESSL